MKALQGLILQFNSLISTIHLAYVCLRSPYISLKPTVITFNNFDVYRVQYKMVMVHHAGVAEFIDRKSRADMTTVSSRGGRIDEAWKLALGRGVVQHLRIMGLSKTCISRMGEILRVTPVIGWPKSGHVNCTASYQCARTPWKVWQTSLENLKYQWHAKQLYKCWLIHENTKNDHHD